MIYGQGGTTTGYNTHYTGTNGYFSMLLASTRPTNKLLALQKDVFDISKVTVVGEPTITSDGVASGFSTSNYLKLPQPIDIGQNKSWEVKFSSTIPELVVGNIITNSFAVGRTNTTGSFVAALYLYNPTTQTSSNIFLPLPNLGANYVGQKYNAVVKYDGVSTYSFFLALENGETRNYSVTSQQYYNNIDLHIGGGVVSTPFDLNAFKIYVDGQLVFQPVKPIHLLERRKKGYDPSKFTVVGSPTITEDGVLTTSNRSINYVKISLQPLGDNWDIILPYNKPQAIEWHTVDTIFRNQNGYAYFSIGSYGNQYYLWLRDINDTDLNTGFATTSYNSIGDCLIKLSCRIINGVYTLNIYSSFDDGSNWNLDKTVTSSVAFYPCNNAMADVRINTDSRDTNASIDLKQFSIKVDGKEVFTGAKENLYMLRR